MKFIKDLFRPFYIFSPLSFLFSIIYSIRFSLNNSGFRPRSDVYLVGSGPSLDMVDVSKIHDSTIVLMNGAISRVDFFKGRGNDIIWLAQDVARIFEFIDDVPDDVRKVLSVHEYRKVYSLGKHLKKGRDVFIHPGLKLRYMMGENVKSVTGVKSLRPKYFGAMGEGFHAGSDWRRAYIAPKSVMLFAIYLFIPLRPSRIITLGFDVPEELDEGSYASGISVKISNNAFPNGVINFYLSGLSDEAESSGVNIFNMSPKTNEKILRKLPAL